MKRQVVLDTNVAVVANGGTWTRVPECVRACVKRLEVVQCSEIVLLDDGHRILGEYARNLSFSGEPGAGDAFFKWLWDRQGAREYSLRVSVTPHDGRGFAEFPDAADLSGFDDDDRKFVAVAIAAGTNPRIVSATDRGWRKYREALDREGVGVELLCPELRRKATRSRRRRSGPTA